MRKLVVSSIVLIFLLTGCSAINSLNDMKKEVVYQSKIDNQNLEVFINDKKKDDIYLEFKINGNYYGILNDKGGYLTDDKYYIYFDEKSVYDIYEDRMLVDPIEVFNWDENRTASIYKLDASKKIEAFEKGTKDLDGISKTFVIVPSEDQKLSYQEVDFDAVELLQLVNSSEQIFPERGGLAVESCELPPHQVALQSASIPFNKEYVQFFTRTTEFMLSVSNPYKGIIRVSTWQLYEDFSDKNYYYQLTDKQIAEFDRITKYNEIVSSTSVE